MVCFVDSELRAFGSIEAEKKVKNRLDFAALEFDAEVQAKHSRVLHQAGAVGPDHVLKERLREGPNEADDFVEIVYPPYPPSAVKDPGS